MMMKPNLNNNHAFSKARQPHSGWFALLAAGLLLAGGGCSTNADPGEEEILSTRSGETTVQVSQSAKDGSQVVRVHTSFRGEDSDIVLRLDQPVWDVEIPLSIQQQRPQAVDGTPGGAVGGSPAEPRAGGTGSDQFSDLLIAQYLAKAQEAMLAGDYNLALRQVNLVLMVRPDHVSAHMMKGSTYYAMGNYEMANEEYEYVLTQDPSNQEVRKFQDFLKKRETAVQPPLPGVPKPEKPAPAPPGKNP
ncbi:MAG: hypothetical protein OEW12_08435 [Deltaproteobacteria bacterium]|nr:hypothetical protein [Deltaproteobacteria bacterium]